MYKNKITRKLFGFTFILNLTFFLFFSFFSIGIVSAPFGYDNPNLPQLKEETFDDYTSDFFMPLNTSVFGDFSFNGGWMDNGLSIIDGDIYAQTGYFYNITSLNVTRQNLTIIENLKIFGNVTADSFIGKIFGTFFNWITDDPMLDFDGSTLSLDRLEFNDSVKKLFSDEQIIYNATSITTKFGTLDSGDLNSITQLADGDTYNVSEVSGGDALEIYINFTGIANFNTVALRGRYNGGSGHHIAIEIFRVGVDWEVRDEITDQTQFGVSTFPVFVGSNFIDGGLVQIRLTHEDNGISSHDYFLDAIFIGQVPGLVSGGSLGDLTERDKACVLLPDVFCKDGSKNMTGNLNAPDFNITAYWGTFNTLYVTGTSYLGDLIISANNISVDNILSKAGSGITFWDNIKIDSYNFSVGNTDLFVNNNLGRIGIGTATPQNLLNVDGDINATGTIYMNEETVLTSTSGSEVDPLWTGNQSSYSSTSTIVGWGHYNTTDFDIADYSTTSTILGWNFYNSTDFDINDYLTAATILGWNYYNTTDFSISDYYTKTEVTTNITSANTSMKAYVDGAFITQADEGDLNVNSSDLLDVYDSTYFMPLNTSVSGNFSFNGGWLNDGLSIIDGDIYAQTGYFYNITSLNVTKQNLTLLEDVNIIGDLTLSEKITFTFGEIIDNIVDGWIRITGNLNVTGDLVVDGFVSQQYVMVTDTKATAVNGGTFTKDLWQTRIITTEDSDTSNIAILVGNLIVLDAGTYITSISAPAFKVDKHIIQLYNVNSSSIVLNGAIAYTSNADNSESRSIIKGKFTIASDQLLMIRHRGQTTKADNGKGNPCNMDGCLSIYTIAEFWKVG